MDNLCHTLVGAALGKAGLERRTPLATAALLIGANLPDVDVLAYVWGADTALAFRRGWTHGLPALVLWPFVLTGLLLAWDRLLRRRRRPEAEPARPRALLLLATVAILTHPFLDWLNTYGMRWWMPFRDVWSYGDVLFIVDPWIWLALLSGILVALYRKRRTLSRPERPARIALAAVAVYILLMGTSQTAARRLVQASLREAGSPPSRTMAGPLPVTPFRRQIVADTGTGYELGTVEWGRSPVFERSRAVVKNAGHPAVAAAARTREGAIFLHWARFPFFLVEEHSESWIVYMVDARYSINPGTGFGRQRVEVAKPRP